MGVRRIREFSSLLCVSLAMSARGIDSWSNDDFGSSGRTPALKIFAESAQEILSFQQPLAVWPLRVVLFSGVGVSRVEID